MGIGRSAFYDTPEARARDLSIVAEMKTICDEFEAYGYRRVDAELRHRGIVVNAKKIRRLMREHALNPRQRRRFIATTDSDHNYPVFPNLAKNMKLDGPNQLWVADITYVTIATGFVYLAAILDAWSRRVIGYAIGRSIDARLAVAALKAAIGARDPPRGCVHHSDRGARSCLTGVKCPLVCGDVFALEYPAREAYPAPSSPKFIRPRGGGIRYERQQPIQNVLADPARVDGN
jgi:putative transposase